MKMETLTGVYLHEFTATVATIGQAPELWVSVRLMFRMSTVRLIFVKMILEE